MIPAKTVLAAAPVITAALLSLVGEGRALFYREFKTFTGPLRVTVAISIERKEKQIEWTADHTQL